MSSKYTKREFQKDLKTLSRLIEDHDKLERKSKHRRQRGGGDDYAPTQDIIDTGMDAEDGSQQDGGRRRTRSRSRDKRRQRGGDSEPAQVPQEGGKSRRRSRTKRGGDSEPALVHQEAGRRRTRSRSRTKRGGDVDAHDPSASHWGSLDGGKKDKRTFKVVSVSGKAVSFGNYTITKDSPIGPGRAATKAASSVCAHVTGKSGKHSVSNQCNNVKFMLKEKTRGSSQKEFGPYLVKVHKRSSAEITDLEKRFKNFGKGKYVPSHYTASAVLVHNK